MMRFVKTVFIGLTSLSLSMFSGILVLIVGTWMSWENAEHPPLTVAVILGKRLDNGQISPALSARLDKAMTLYDEEVASYFVLSGGVPQGEGDSEAQAMKAYLQERGFPTAHLILENQSTTTIDNLYYCKLLLDSLDCEPVYLVTSQSHLCRAMLIAERCGVSAIGVPADMAGNALEICGEYLYEAACLAYFLAVEQWDMVNPDDIPSYNPQLKYAFALRR